MYKTIVSLTLSLLLGLSGYANAHDHMSDDDSAEEMPATDRVSENEDVDDNATDAETSTDMEDSSDTAATTATRFSCSYDNMVRSIEVVYEQPGFTVPCSVVYHKETESPGDIKTLWSADNQAGYCEEKASEFSEKLEGFGWDCQSTGS